MGVGRFGSVGISFRVRLVAATASWYHSGPVPPARVVRRVVARTVRRRVTDEELWDGNREQALWRFLVDRDHIVRWAWRTRSKTPRSVAEAFELRPELVPVRLRSPRECEAWVAALAGTCS